MEAQVLQEWRSTLYTVQEKNRGDEDEESMMPQTLLRMENGEYILDIEDYFEGDLEIHSFPLTKDETREYLAVMRNKGLYTSMCIFINKE